MHHNYGHNPEFATIYADAYKILMAAKAVRSADLVRDRAAIRSELEAVEPLFHLVLKQANAAWRGREAAT